MDRTPVTLLGSLESQLAHSPGRLQVLSAGESTGTRHLVPTIGRTYGSAATESMLPSDPPG